MLQKWKAFEVAFWNWMRQSGTIAWARLQMLLGVVLYVLSVTDVSPLFADHPKLLVIYLIVVGGVTEFIRRSGTEVQTTQSYIPDLGRVEVKTLVPTNPTPPPLPPQG